MERETGLEPDPVRCSVFQYVADHLFSAQYVTAVAACFSLWRRESTRSLPKTMYWSDIFSADALPNRSKTGPATKRDYQVTECLAGAARASN
jgi:hypothetical protein